MPLVNRSRSEDLFRRAQQIIPGGVNSPVRAFRSVGGTPPFLARGEGSHVFDVDGNEYIDYVGSWGPLLLGHRHPAILSALEKALEIGTSFGAPTEAEVELAAAICDAVPSIEMVRLVNSGTEATMAAIRVARGFTGRDLIVKFEGCYHGHVDSLLVKAGSGVATLGIADTRGVPRAFCDTTLALPYNSAEAVEQAFHAQGDRIAAVIVEPVVGNMGCVPPLPGYLESLREITTRHGALLIFDEIPTGLGKTGRMFACEHEGVAPDILVLGKALGGGILPIAACIARSELDVARDLAFGHYTHEKNPVTARAALTTIEIIEDEDLVGNAERVGALALERLQEMKQRLPAIGDVRGRGLLLGIELVKSRVEKLPDNELAEVVLYRSLDRGLSFKTTMGNVLTLTPPLTVSAEEMMTALHIVAEAIAAGP